MGELSGFIRRHVWPAIFLVIGPAIYIGSLMLDGIHLMALGLPGWLYQIVGSLLFFSAVIVLLFRFYSELQQAQGKFPLSQDLGATTRDVAKGAAAVSAPPKSEIETTIEYHESNDRIFIGPETTLQYLNDLFRGNTSIQANRLIEPYRGKWIKISGAVEEVTAAATVTFNYGAGHLYLAFMYFDKKWIDQLSILRHGDKITVIGKIQTVSSYYIALAECELVKRSQ